MEKEKDKDLWHIFTSRFAIPLLTASLGFGGSQLLAVQGLRDRVLFNTQHMDTIDKSITDERSTRMQVDSENRAYMDKQHSAIISHQEKAMEYVTGLLEKVVQQNTEVIALIKVQQQMNVKSP